MRLILTLSLLFILNNILCQKYIVERALKNDASVSDICPTVFSEGIIYMSNEKTEYLRTVKDVSDHHPYHLFYQPIDSTKTKGKKVAFAEEISSLYNDGPLNVFASESKIVFSRNNNNSSLKRRDQSTTIGIYFSEKINGLWTKPEPFEYNSSQYNVTHPAISQDGKLLVFSSGENLESTGMDLYFSILKGTQWSAPQRFGNDINTDGNDVYPTIVNSKIYYSTNGRNDSTGLDIYSFNFKNLSIPVKLDSAINTSFDDFGITFNSDLISGYVTSNREGSDQIYFFKKQYPTLDNCTKQKKISYCYLIEEHNMLDESGMPLKFTWDLGDGTSKDGYRVKHCYDTLGHFTAKLNIVDTITGDVFFEVSEVSINIQAEPVPRIIYKDTLNKNELTEFKADFTYTSTNIDEIYWQTNNNEQIYFGDKFIETTTQRDSIEVKLGLLNGNEVQCYSKIFYYNENKIKPNSQSNKPKEVILNNKLDSTESYAVKIQSSETPIPDTSFIFNDVNYPITEKYFEFKKLYEYSVGNSIEMEELYLLYLEMKELGFDSELIKTEIDKTIESKKETKTFTTIYFAISSSDVSPFSQSNIQNFIKKHGTDIELNILGYADPTGNAVANKQLSLERAKSVKEELTKLGIPSANISIKAMGEIEASVEDDHVLKLLRKVEIELKK